MDQNLPNQNQNKEINVESPKVFSKFSFLKRRTIILGAVIIGIIILVALILAITSITQKPVSKTATPEELAREQLENLPGSLLFEPASVTAIPGQSNTVDILMNTGGHEVYGVILAVKYVPQVIGNVELVQFKDPVSAISSTFEVTGKPLKEDGAILITLKLPAGTPPLKGVGKIATLKFIPKKVNVAIPATYIDILPISNFIRTEDSREIPVNTNKLMVKYQ